MIENNQVFTLASCQKCHAVNKVKPDLMKDSKGVCGQCGSELKFHQLVSEVDLIGLQALIQKSHMMPVVVDFWAPWCGPCMMFAPTYERASLTLQGKVAFVKINTQNFPEASEVFGIRGIPTLAIFKNGKEVTRQSGAFPYDLLIKWLNEFAV